MKNMTFEEAKEFVKKLGLVAHSEQEAADRYNTWWLDNRTMCEEIGLPQYPNIYYANELRDPLNLIDAELKSILQDLVGDRMSIEAIIKILQKDGILDDSYNPTEKAYDEGFVTKVNLN